MSSTFDNNDGATPELVLKTIPPRAPAHLLARPRLSSAAPALKDRQITVVQAPAGFGKTSLLAQRRRENLMHGTAVAWLAADERDDPYRLLLGLVHAIRAACARPSFGRLVLKDVMAPVRELDGMTAWLAEVAQLSLNVLLIVDEIERLPESGVEQFNYLLHNAPPNLQVVAAGRPTHDLALADLMTYGQAVTVGPKELCFRLDETISLMGSRFGTRVDADHCARIHEYTDGWPLGLQMALAAMDRATDPCEVIDAMSAGPGTFRDHFVSRLMATLSEEDSDLLARLSVTDLVHPGLSCVLTGDALAGERLMRLVRETPFFTTGENTAWCRLHLSILETLRARLARLPASERTELHARATTWLMQHGMLDEAARHAHAAGQHQVAYDLAEQCLHDAVTQGHLNAVLDWLRLLPAQELERRPRLRLAAAWALALGTRHGEAQEQVARILANPLADTALRYECALITSAAAFYSDEIDRYMEIFEPWVNSPPGSPAWLAQAHANRLAARTMLRGEPALARRVLQSSSPGDLDKRTAFIGRWGDLAAGQSYFLEGKMHLAEQALRPALESTEAELGRRHPLTSMFAAMLAAVAYGADRIDEAATLLANRLDVLERAGMPDTVIIGYRTAACVAAAQGVSPRALDLLDTLYTIGKERRLPRLCIASLGEQVRMHAARFHAETCTALVRRMDELAACHDIAQGPLWNRSVAMLLSMAHAHAAIAARHWHDALKPLGKADELAGEMNMHAVRIEVMALRALAMEQAQGNGRSLLLEARNLAQGCNLTRTMMDAHPAIATWVERLKSDEPEAAPGALAASTQRVVQMPAPRTGERPRMVPTTVLTSKERAVLELLARNLSNKEIALAMEIGEETVKWHLKNLFRKLDSSSRKHVVHRATALGLLETAY